MLLNVWLLDILKNELKNIYKFTQPVSDINAEKITT
jgi:hypothetical protein